jgi:uncharacterized protein YoxC
MWKATQDVLALRAQIKIATTEYAAMSSTVQAEGQKIADSVAGIGVSVAEAQESAAHAVAGIATMVDEESARATSTLGAIGAEVERTQEAVRETAQQAREAGEEVDRTTTKFRDHLAEALENMDRMREEGTESEKLAARLAAAVASGAQTLQAAREQLKLYDQEARDLFESLDPAALQQGFQRFLADVQSGKLTLDEILDEVDKRFEGVGNVADQIREALQGADGDAQEMLERLRQALADVSEEIGGEAGAADLLGAILGDVGP